MHHQQTTCFLGRHQGPSRKNIICINCCNQNINVFEDEYHFVVKCSLHNYLRGKYIPMVKNLNDYVADKFCVSWFPL